MEYLSVADTAKLVRKALKANFPTTKFSVRSSSYAGGASIDVSWTDGPKVADVDAVTSPYEGSGFDGMIDLKTSNQHWLTPDGKTEVFQYRVGHSYGSTTVDAEGETVDPDQARDYVAGVRIAYGTATYPGYDDQADAFAKGVADGVERQANGARLVHFGADFIHTRRDLSAGERERLERAVAFLGGDPSGQFDNNKRYSFGAPGLGHWWEDYGSTLVHRLSGVDDKAIDEALNDTAIHYPTATSGVARLVWVFEGGRPVRLAWWSLGGAAAA